MKKECAEETNTNSPSQMQSSLLSALASSTGMAKIRLNLSKMVIKLKCIQISDQSLQHLTSFPSITITFTYASRHVYLLLRGHDYLQNKTLSATDSQGSKAGAQSHPVQENTSPHA